jgi:hypothetical protein
MHHFSNGLSIVHFLVGLAVVDLLGQKLGKMRFPGECKIQKIEKSNW